MEPVDRPEDLVSRTKRFSLDVIKFVVALPKNDVARTLGKQLLRSGTSVGANYREGRRGRSTAEFTAKLGIAQFEAEESCYWLELIMESGIAKGPNAGTLHREAAALQAILGASIVTATRNAKR